MTFKKNVVEFPDSFERVSGWCNVALRDMLRPSDGLASRSFCWSDISRVQQKSNWRLGKRFLASDSKTVWKSRLILSKSLLNFFNGCFGNSSISKELALKEPLDAVMLHSGTCSNPPMALQTNHFLDGTFRGSNWTVDESLLAFGQEAVRKWRLNLLKGQWISFERASGWCHVATGELLRLSDGLGNRSFCRLDISRVQLQSNWTVVEK